LQPHRHDIDTTPKPQDQTINMFNTRSTIPTTHSGHKWDNPCSRKCATSSADAGAAKAEKKKITSSDDETDVPKGRKGKKKGEEKRKSRGKEEKEKEKEKGGQGKRGTKAR
ncbi:hypothetical protein L208DRAFT_1417976, partial [Tricholoma matsutake]